MEDAVDRCSTCHQEHADNIPCDVAAKLIEAMQRWTGRGRIIVERGGNVVTLTAISEEK